MGQHLRLDVIGAVTSTRRTPQGGLIAPANLTRVGVFQYQQPDGRTVRELRLPEEVFKADSLASLAAAPLTVGHPDRVTPANYTSVSKGHVDGVPTHDERYVKADVRVQDQGTIDGIERKDLVELSCGYTCDVEATSGTWNGEKYDAIQRNIQYNHVAIGPKDWGRAGNEVKLRLDSGYGVCTYVDMNMADEKENKPAAASAQEPRQDAAVEALRGQVAFLTGEVARLNGELTAARTDSAVEKRAQAIVAARDARATLVAKAAQACPAFKCDGKTDVEVMADVCAELRPDLKLDGRSADYISAVFDMACANMADTRKDQAAVQAATPTPETAKDQTANRQDGVAIAQARNAYESQNAWRGAQWLKDHPFTA